MRLDLHVKAEFFQLNYGLRGRRNALFAGVDLFRDSYCGHICYSLINKERLVRFVVENFIRYADFRQTGIRCYQDCSDNTMLDLLNCDGYHCVITAAAVI